MEKVVRGLFLTLLVLGMGGAANAGWTTVVYNQTVVSEVALNAFYVWGANGVGWHYGVSWDHEWMIPSDPDIVNLDITAASLAIESQYTSGTTETVRLDSQANPSLGNLADGWTSFNILTYEPVLDGDVTVYVKLFDKAPDDYGPALLKKSKMEIEYEVTMRVWEDDPIPDPPEVPAVPAPAAVVLCSLGAGLVGWLRRRGAV